MSENISTAVDSLVKLVNDKERISVDDASRELGIPVNILTEWATFLDQEKIINIEYKFTTPYLIKAYNKINEKEVKKTSEEVLDLVVRRLSVTLNFVVRSNPKDKKSIEQKEYLIRNIRQMIESAKKGNINKDELKKIVEYYKIYKNSLN